MPIYVAASGPKMLELAGRIADGVIILVGTDLHSIRQARERIEAGARAANRDPRAVDLVLWVPCSISDRLPAKDAVKAHVARIVAHPLPFLLEPREQKVLEEIRQAYNYYQHMEQKASQAQVIPDWLVDKFAIAGTRQECVAQLDRLRETGINQIAIIPYGADGGDRGETLREFAAAIL
jgi:5,10-methylenetetrahydromethanopterin reductase